jgi:PAS domain S-box-containing protein
VLGDSARLLERVFASLRSAVFVVDGTTGLIVHCNRAASLMFGQPYEEFIGRSFRILHGEQASADRTRDEVLQQAEGGFVPSRRMTMRRADGALFPCEATVTRLDDDDGRLLGYVGVVRDLTEMHRSEEARRTSEERFGALVETMPDMLSIHDRLGRFLYASPAAGHVLGRPAAQLLGMSAFELIHPEDRPRALAKFAGVAESGSGGKPVEFRVLDPTGEWSWVETIGSNHVHDPGIGGILLVTRTIGDRKQAEADLRASEERFRTLVESMEDVVFSMDRDLRYVEMFGRWDEPSWVARAGWSREQLIGKTLHDTFGPETSRHEPMYRRVLDGEHVVYEWATVNEGVHRYFQTSLSPLRSTAGAIDGLVGIGRDVTERKRIESQLHQAQKLESIGQLAAGIAHEINTPIQFVGDNLRFLADSFSSLGPMLSTCRDRAASEDDTAAGQDLDYILTEVPSAIGQSLEGVDRVARIVRAMKAFSHPDSGDKSTVDVNAALDATITIARNEWKYVADVRTDYAADLPPVLCLPSEMNQVFLNILVNAAHAISDTCAGSPGGKGLITVSTRHSEGWAEIRFGDTGAGIPDEVAGRIFDPFFTTKPVGKGTGQGLTIAHAVVVGKHQGTLTFESHPGHGTTFVIRLPIDGLPADVRA